MKIVSCKTNHIVNPLGFMMKAVTFSWITEETTSKKQTAAQIKVASDGGFSNILYDSGKSEDISSLAAKIPVELSPCTRYFWTVQVWGDEGDTAVSDVNWFETGKMEEPWQGRWISPNSSDKNVHPYLRKSFKINGNVKTARAYITGIGIYNLEINGKRISEEYLTPYCNAYDSWVQYQTFDVADALQEGDNVIGVMLGNGWAKGRFGLGSTNSVYCDEFALLCELRLETESGVSTIGSDDTWKWAPSPVQFSGIYDGEIYDANAEIKAWSEPGLNDDAWEPVKLFDYSLGPVVERLSLPVVVKDRVKPIALLNTPAGEQVIDMGQNMVGWLKFRINEPKGTEIKLMYGEVLQEDNFYRDNLRSAKQEYTCISDGSERYYEPLFTFYGFRYIKLEGFSSKISLEDFEGIVVYSDMEDIGTIETSDPLVDRLFLNAIWGQRGNFVDVPTDCPQRDERLGWTGDTQVFAGTASFNMDTYAFYAKFLHDLYEEQKGSDGMVHHFVPTLAPKATRDNKSIFGGAGGACAWADCATIVPWEVYLHSGDPSILADQFESMKDWVGWIQRQDEASGGRKLWTTGFHFGDWLALDGPGGSSPMGGTDNDFLASAFYKLSSELTAKAAKVLGREEEAKYYQDLSNQVKAAIQDEFFTKTGRVAIRTQTAHIVALHFKLVPDNLRQRVFDDLLALLKKDNMHLKTGFIGTPYLCRVLSENGASDAAYEIFYQEDYPSWLYAVNLGATTIWERWNSLLPDGKISDTGMNSLNHYSYGSIAEWMYRHVCGLNPHEEVPGFKKFTIRPEIYGKLSYAKAKLRSASGNIESGWVREADGNLCIKVKIPFNTSAEVILPYANLDEIAAQGYANALQEGEAVRLELDSGEYTFKYKTKKDYSLRYSYETPLAKLLEVPETKEVLFAQVPRLANRWEGRPLPYSIAAMDPGMQMFAFGTNDFTELNTQLAKIPVSIREK